MIINNISKLIFCCLIFSLTQSNIGISQNVLSGKKIYSLTKNNLKNDEGSEPYQELDKYLTDYEVFEIDVQKDKVEITTDNPFLTLELAERSFDMNLFQDNVVVRYKGKNMPLLLGGSLRTGGIVSLSVNDDFLYGYIQEGNNTMYIEPLHYMIPDAPQGTYVTYNTSAVIPDTEHKCGVDETMHQAANLLPPTKAITSCKVIELAIANTRNMVTKYGNNTATQNHNLGVLNNVATHYRSEFTYNVEFDVVAHYFPTSTSNNPLTPNTATTDAVTLLNNFKNWSQSGNQGGGNSGGANGGFGVDYNMGTLWTDRDITWNGSSGTVGLAYTPGWHHLLEDYTTTAASLGIMVTHEKGHNFSANHDAAGSISIMAPSVTMTDVWSTSSKNSINSRLNSLSYLDNCSTLGAPTANFFQNAVSVCSGSMIEFEDQSQYGATRLWEFTGGSPATSTDEKPTVTYNTSGMHLVKITSTNASGSDVHLGYVDVQPSPPTICTPSGGSGGSGGITGVSLNGMYNNSPATGLYENFSCSNVASVEPNTTYSMVVGVTGVTRIRYFADYNDDGDFSDSGEASGLLSFSGTGNLGVTLNTAANPVLGELLRFRIIVSTSSIAADGCTVPSTGQVEDYSLYFGQMQVYGCTDPTASNYDPNATVDDGSCNTGGTATTWYRDADNDGFGNPNNSTSAVNQPAGFIANNMDCNDSNANIYPGATEVCDGEDNNCNGQVDEGLTNTYYLDADNDGYGHQTVSTQACSAPTGYVTNNTDCNDSNANINPGATEICDGQDNNCNGQTDEGVMNTYYMDSDNDGYGNPNASMQDCSQPSGFVNNNTDCNDNNANVNPGAPEICDGLDNNCNGQVDEGVNQTTYYIDNDGDGYGSTSNSVTGCSQPSGYVPNSTDCNDNNANINPAAPEICDGLDNNCNGQVDEGVNQSTYYADNDGDGYGNASNSTTSCSQPSGYVTNSLDCNDNNSSINPAANEVCDNLDNNCNGVVDEGCSSGTSCDGAMLVINTITQNIYRAQIAITSTATVDGNNNILFTAGNSIELKPGFQVILGTDFEARIEPCTNFAPGGGTNETNHMVELGDLYGEIDMVFPPDSDVNIVIYNAEKTSVERKIKTSKIQALLYELSPQMEKGSYKLKISADGKELEQEIFIIK